jgi:hypothetical protein
MTTLSVPLEKGGRVANEEFLAKPLRVHSFLADVPLHDVWKIPLDGGGTGRTVADALRLIAFDHFRDAGPIVRGLFWLRGVLGRVFRWDNPTAAQARRYADLSYVHRLTEADRARSLVEPGSESPLFPAVYQFENEGLYEIMNGTVQAFALLALEPAARGYALYLAIYVRRMNWLTPFYMTLIDPFRKLFVYPALIRQVQGAWAAAYGKS